MPEENKRDSNESSGSFQRALDSLVVMKPIFDPIRDIQGVTSSKKTRTTTQFKKPKNDQPISLEALKGADRTTTPNGRIVTKKEILRLQETCLQWEAANHLDVSTKQLRKICIQLDIPLWPRPYERRKIVDDSKQMPDLEELLQMETEMGASRARSKLGLSKRKFIQLCQVAGMDHRWNHRKAKNAGSQFVRAPPVPKSP